MNSESVNTLEGYGASISHGGFWILMAVGLLFLGGSLLLSLCAGPIHLSLDRIFTLLGHRDQSLESLIFYDTRLPRTLLALMVGAAFSVSGVIMQGVTRNPLACPSLLGVNQGAAFTMLVMLLCFPALPTHWFVPAAFLGALLAAGIMYALNGVVGSSPLRLALAGIIVNELFHAFSRLLLIFSPGDAQSALFNILGSLAGKTWEQVFFVMPWILVGLGASVFFHRSLTVFSLGHCQATGLGVSVKRMYFVLMIIALLLAAAAVSVAGPIPFLGLMVPQGLRYYVGARYQQLLILSMVYGGALLVFSDALLRLLNPVTEIPVGLFVALLGGPFFIMMARNTRKVQEMAS